jgi:thioredoxin-dependent peroxiredoxin
MTLLLTALALLIGCADPAGSGTKDTGGAGDDTAADTAADTATDTNTDSAPLSLIGTTPAEAIGAPEFSAQNRDGAARSRMNLLGQPTVMWFFPGADTPGCTVEGCGYRDLKERFDALGVQIVGVGFNPPEAMQAWAEDEGFTYELWTDTDRTLALTYGAAKREDQASPSRITMLLDADGRLLLEYKGAIDTGTHPKDVLDDCEALFGR